MLLGTHFDTGCAQRLAANTPAMALTGLEYQHAVAVGQQLPG